MILISACLCGLNCKYDGGNNEHPFFAAMLERGEVITVCPEVLGGLPIPRKAAEICEGTGQDVLEGRAQVITRDGEDLTQFFVVGAKRALELAQEYQVDLVVLKSNSPSCGVGKIYDGTFTHQLREGYGVTAALLKENGFPVVSEVEYLEGAWSGVKAISLFSGGLDSQLAVRLIQNQGIVVTGINFSSPFFGADKRTERAAHDLGIDLRVEPVGEEYLERVLKNPVYGYGKNMNPCIDCHAFMFRKAGDLMEELGASFIITGEVLGQRPMSQNRSALNAVDKLSGYKGYIVRPLSARLLEATVPEKEGWIQRELLLDISGRSRTRQMKLAEEYGIKEYPSPAGGCLLTEQNFARRLKKNFAPYR